MEISIEDRIRVHLEDHIGVAEWFKQDVVEEGKPDPAQENKRIIRLVTNIYVLPKDIEIENGKGTNSRKKKEEKLNDFLYSLRPTECNTPIDFTFCRLFHLTDRWVLGELVYKPWTTSLRLDITLFDRNLSIQECARSREIYFGERPQIQPAERIITLRPIPSELYFHNIQHKAAPYQEIIFF